MPDNIQSNEGRLLASMLEVQGRQLGKVEEAMQRVGEALEHLGRLDERLVSIQRERDEDRKLINGHETRLQVMEVAMPPLKEIRRWVIVGVGSAAGIVFTGLVGIILRVIGTH